MDKINKKMSWRGMDKGSSYLDSTEYQTFICGDSVLGYLTLDILKKIYNTATPFITYSVQ